MSKWLITHSQSRGAKWRLVEFGGQKGAESRGIVDFIAIRKNHRFNLNGTKRGDLFDIVLVQSKGGGAKGPSPSDINRLSRVVKHHRAREVVLAKWKKGKSPTLQRLKLKKWYDVTSSEIFG